MIYKVDSLISAEHVINILLNDTELQGVNGFVESYQNGREQGLLLFHSQESCFYICHHRRGDSPTVYHGKYEMKSISDDAYSHCHSFKSEYEAAMWIKSELLEGQS